MPIKQSQFVCRGFRAQQLQSANDNGLEFMQTLRATAVAPFKYMN